MGNTSSQQQQQDNDIESNTTHKSIKVPKHLQPLKRKQTKKNSSNNNSSNVSNNNPAPPKISMEQSYNISSPVKTLQVKPQHFTESLDLVDPSSSSPQLFRWTKGRRFQNNDVRSQQDLSYPLPNDQTELDRHRVQYYIIRWALESRHIVPPIIKQKLFEGIKVLDVGCGPGLWLGHPVIDMAQDFSKSTFDAINVCNLLPPSIRQQFNMQDEGGEHSSTFKPPHRNDNNSKKQQQNLSFTMHNVAKDGPMPYNDNTFDFTQQALATLAYKTDEWKSVLSEMKRVTKPGGYIQLIEVDFYIQPLGEGGGLWRDQVLDQLKRKRDIDGRIACQLSNLLTEIGLIEIETRFVSVPVGSWGLDIGNLWEQNVEAFLEAARPFLVDLLKVTDNQFRKDRKRLKEEWRNGKVKPFNNIHVAWGRIPSN